MTSPTYLLTSAEYEDTLKAAIAAAQVAPEPIADEKAVLGAGIDAGWAMLRRVGQPQQTPNLWDISRLRKRFIIPLVVVVATVIAVPVGLFTEASLTMKILFGGVAFASSLMAATALTPLENKKQQLGVIVVSLATIALGVLLALNPV